MYRWRKQICKQKNINCKTQSRIFNKHRNFENPNEVSSGDDETPIPIVPTPMSPVVKDYTKNKNNKSPGSLFSQHYERSSKSVVPSATKKLKENIFAGETEETPANEYSLDNFIQQTANKFIDDIKTPQGSPRKDDNTRTESRNSPNMNRYVTPTK